ncbi:hypothetical protein D3C78_1287210 [compost metagenome]
MSRALVKPAEFQGVVGECARCHGGAPLSRKNKSHPVKAFIDLADESFVGMLLESINVKKPVQLFDRFAQVPTRLCKEQEVVHVADIDELGTGGESLVHGIEVEGRKQRTDRTAAGNPFDGCMKYAVDKHTIVDNLRQQIAQQRVVDLFT